MKKRNYILPFLLSGALMGSCTLDRISYTEIYPEQFFRNESDLDKALTALYVPISSDWGNLYCADQWSYTTISDFTTDIMKCTWVNFNHFYEHWWTADGNDNGTQFAQRMYAKYNELTRIYSTIKKIEACPANDNAKRQAIAEAKCLYGWLGVILYDLLGPVPLVTDEVIEEPQEKIIISRLSDEEYSSIMENYLTEAAEGLPTEQSDWGRATKGLARMLLLKLHMINKDFVKAEAVARELYAMEGNPYKLLQIPYADIFSKAQVRNKEIIYAVPCGQNMPNYWLAEVLPNDYPYPYTCEKWNGYKMSWDFYDTFEEGDRRLESIISSYTSTGGEKITRGMGALAEGAIPRKYGEDDAEIQGEIGTIDIIVYRFADVLLSLAECINENEGAPTPEAVNLVNRIRNRAGLPNLTAERTANYQAFKDAILDERGHEFYCEGLRRQDLIRHGKFISTSKKLYPNSQSDWYKVRFPIVSYYINESAGQVKQNEGY